MATDQDAGVDVVVVGAGVGGICAAVAAAHEGARVILLEASQAIGGTGVHAYPGLITRHWADDGRYINDGLHRRFFPESYAPGVEAVLLAWGQASDPDRRQALNRLTPMPLYEAEALLARYRSALEAYRVDVRCGCRVRDVERQGRRITALLYEDAQGQPCRLTAGVVVDGCFNADVAHAAGAEAMLGRPDDGSLQPATLILTITDVDVAAFDLAGWPPQSVAAFMRINAELGPVYQRARAAGLTDNPRENVLCFVRPDLRSVLCNQTRVFDVRPDDPASIAAGRAAAERQAQDFLAIMRAGHPAFAQARIGGLASRLGLRDGRRIRGDHLLTGDECLAGARFPDMVAACANFIDIHGARRGDRHGGRLGDSGYFHIPYRCLIPVGLDNLLIASRAISCDFEAHGATRVMAPVACYGEAAGIAAALAAADRDVRVVAIPELQARLRAHGQFVEEGP